MAKKIKPKKGRIIRYVVPINRSPTFCKVFSERNFETLEKVMNDWLEKAKPILRDQTLAVTSYLDTSGTYPEILHKYTMVIFYCERESV